MHANVFNKDKIKGLIGRLHARHVFERRTLVLADTLARHLAGCGNVLDVGTGDGLIARMIMDRAEAVSIQGIDVLVRPETHIPVSLFDGRTLPFADDSFDAVTFVDVLHHTKNPDQLIAEAARVSRGVVVIKDHLAENWLDHTTLRFMDWVGNAPHGVVLPYNYASRATWLGRFDTANLEPETLTTEVPLYPAPFNLVFGRGLHFVARLRPKGETRTACPQES